MVKGYITRGTTVHGKPVNQGDFIDLDPDTFRLLNGYGDVIPAEQAPKPAKTEANTKPKKD